MSLTSIFDSFLQPFGFNSRTCKDKIALTRTLHNGEIPPFYITNVLFDDIKDTGCYILMVQSNIGSNGIYCLSKSEKQKNGDVSNMCSSCGPQKEKMCVSWGPYEFPSIKFTFHDTQPPHKVEIVVKIIHL